MLKYFYFLYFQYFDKLNNPSTFFNLGYFSTKKNAMKTMDFYRNLEGFRQHPTSCFHIIRQGVRFDYDIVKSGITLFELCYDENDGYDEENTKTIFGLFKNKSDAKKQKNKELKNKKFNIKNNYSINRIIIDHCITGWEDGFTSIDSK